MVSATAAPINASAAWDYAKSSSASSLLMSSSPFPTKYDQPLALQNTWILQRDTLRTSYTVVTRKGYTCFVTVNALSS